MKHAVIGFILAAAILLGAAEVWANCATQTYFIGGRVVMCTVCCDMFGNCTTSCF